ncbi:MAG: ATP-binding protein [Chloroflexi bacterium]|nr:ATP-binding protein [Chloroflexota bacterium]
MVQTEPMRGIADVGDVVGRVEVSIGPRFLDLFSSHLYSSPNKAFEELVSNSWDAGAKTVHVGVPEDLSQKSAAVWVLDDGESMDLEGLRELWAVASSQKRDRPSRGRPPIGKFGIGKLATYLLAHQLTYVCRAADGVVRVVTMDYRQIDKSGASRLNIDAITLKVRVLTDSSLKELLSGLAAGDEILELIRSGVPKPKDRPEWENEFGGEDPPPNVSCKGYTWTLAVLTALKPAGRDMQTGRIKWLLRTALPLGSSISIVFNGEPLSSSKVSVRTLKEWIIGDNLGLPTVVLPNGQARAVTEYRTPYTHVVVEGVPGRISGRVRLYAERVSGGKSDILESSNGFFVNILGRVINLPDPYFGLENLNHTAWAKFRAAVRADGLDQILAVNREAAREGDVLTVFRAFLRALFNKARTTHDEASQAAWPSAGDVLAEAWSAVPLEPLRRVVSEGLGSAGGVPDFIDTSGIGDMEAALAEWNDVAANRPGDLITDVVLEDLPVDAPLVSYDLAARRVVVNRNHPFSREHGETHEQQLLLRDTALVELLTESQMVNVGIHESLLTEVREYKDQVLRLVAQIRRRTGVQIASMLVNATDHVKGLERAVGDALEYLGFWVERLAQPGEPEGVATAPMSPNSDDIPDSYRFTYDAKSSGSGKVQTKDLNIAGLARHRQNHSADYTLVVAPDFALGALQQECQNNGVTPMRARDLAKLLMLAAANSPLNLAGFRSLFGLCDPDHVQNWVDSLAETVSSEDRLSLGVFLAALADIGYAGPNAITVSVVADRIGRMPDIRRQPRRPDVQKLVAGLAVLVPNLISINGDNVFLSTTPQKLREAIIAQVRSVPPAYRFGMDRTLGTE